MIPALSYVYSSSNHTETKKIKATDRWTYTYNKHRRTGDFFQGAGNPMPKKIIYVQWRRQDFLFGGRTLSSSPPLLPFPSPLTYFPVPLSLRSRPPKFQLGDLGERCKLPDPSGVWGGAPAEIEFGAFLP